MYKYNTNSKPNLAYPDQYLYFLSLCLLVRCISCGPSCDTSLSDGRIYHRLHLTARIIVQRPPFLHYHFTSTRYFCTAAQTPF